MKHRIISIAFIFFLSLFVGCHTGTQTVDLSGSISRIKSEQIALYRDSCIQNLYFDAVRNPSLLEKDDAYLGKFYFQLFSQEDQIKYVKYTRELISNKNGE